jgi:hypothetical protein
MKSTTLELFWVEKIKLTQNTINTTKQLLDQQLDYSNESSTISIRKVLETMVGHDKKFANYLPFAIKLGQFLHFPKANQIEIEKELSMVRDNFNPPALPPHLSGHYYSICKRIGLLVMQSFIIISIQIMARE